MAPPATFREPVAFRGVLGHPRAIEATGGDAGGPGAVRIDVRGPILLGLTENARLARLVGLRASKPFQRYVECSFMRRTRPKAGCLFVVSSVDPRRRGARSASVVYTAGQRVAGLGSSAARSAHGGKRFYVYGYRIPQPH